MAVADKVVEVMLVANIATEARIWHKNATYHELISVKEQLNNTY